MTEIDAKRQTALNTLKAQYEMNEISLKETERMLKDRLKNDGTKAYTKAQVEDKLEPLRDMLNDTLQQYVNEGGNPEDLTNKKGKKRVVRKYEAITKPTANEKIASEVEPIVVEKKDKPTYIPKRREYSNSVAFDVIPLPSKGLPYRHKTERVQVAYLTANDENMFVSPNLYRDGLLIDYLLEDKILDNGIEPSELLDGDRDAIILWLRATGYGNEFPITATDKATNTEFESVIDLSTIKFKDFNLESDERGWFDFVLPASGDETKFRFLNHRENEELKKLDVAENPASVKARLATISQELRDFLDIDTSMGRAQKNKLYEACRSIEDWQEGIEDDGKYYTSSLTNRLEAQIMAVNGNTNRQYIADYVLKMNVRDSLALRKYINENEPGLDFNVEVEKPASLGGGSQTVFLPLDQFIFLNIA